MYRCRSCSSAALRRSPAAPINSDTAGGSSTAGTGTACTITGTGGNKICNWYGPGTLTHSQASSICTGTTPPGAVSDHCPSGSDIEGCCVMKDSALCYYNADGTADDPIDLSQACAQQNGTWTTTPP